MKEEKCEKEFFIKAAKALGWYKIETKTTLSIIGQYVKLSESAVSKYLIAPQKADDLEAEIFAGKRKNILNTEICVADTQKQWGVHCGKFYTYMMNKKIKVQIAQK